MSAAETWRPVVGHEGFYEVSNLGRVRTATRKLQRGWATFTRRHRLLATTLGGRRKNYRRVNLPAGGRRVHAYVHHLVCRAFHGPRPGPEHLVCHKDDLGTNNESENLYWGTYEDNRRDFARNHDRAVDPGGYVADEYAGGF